MGCLSVFACLHACSRVIVFKWKTGTEAMITPNGGSLSYTGYALQGATQHMPHRDLESSPLRIYSI